MIEGGLLLLAELDLEREAETHVNFSAALDDGEAITGAIAFHRNWAIATDDRAAINLFRRDAPHLQIVTTPELVKYWADAARPASQAVKQCLENIVIGARYRPARSHPLHGWWRRYTNPD